MPLDFGQALQSDGLSIIAEVKRASPSKGVIRKDFKPVEIARSYEENGAECISVLTEERYFLGHPDDLSEIRQTVHIPILRKDFIVEERQIRESYDLGADAILLIVAALSKPQLKSLKFLAEEFGLTCLVEINCLQELEIALDVGASLIGINNRDLKTFKTDVSHSLELKRNIPRGISCVSESGINTAEDCRILHENGFDAVLAGEVLMRQPDPGSFIRNLLGLTK